MLFLIESVIACVVFTLLIKLISHNRQEVFTNDYPPVVTDKLRKQGLIAEKTPAKKKDIIRKLTAKDIYCFFFTGFFYIMMGKAGPRRKKLIAKLVGRKPEEAERLLYPNASWQSWKNQDYCLIDRPINFEVFKNTDMHIWHGIKSDVEKKLARDIQKWQDAGYAFTYKVFPNVGHGGLAGEHTAQLVEKIKTVHNTSLAK